MPRTSSHGVPNIGWFDRPPGGPTDTPIHDQLVADMADPLSTPATVAGWHAAWQPEPTSGVEAP